MVSLPKRRNLKSVWGLPRALALLGATGISITTGFRSSSAPWLRGAGEAEDRQRTALVKRYLELAPPNVGGCD